VSCLSCSTANPARMDRHRRRFRRATGAAQQHRGGPKVLRILQPIGAIAATWDHHPSRRAVSRTILRSESGPPPLSRHGCSPRSSKNRRQRRRQMSRNRRQTNSPATASLLSKRPAAFVSTRRIINECRPRFARVSDNRHYRRDPRALSRAAFFRPAASRLFAANVSSRTHCRPSFPSTATTAHAPFAVIEGATRQEGAAAHQMDFRLLCIASWGLQRS
jgi:hypothetical protein